MTVYYEDSNTKLFLDNCMFILPTIPNNNVNMILTDIPYGEVNRKSNGLRNLDKGKADIETFDVSNFVAECVRVCSGSIYIFCGTEQVSLIRSLLVQAQLSTRLCIWEKPNPSPMNGKHIWLSGIECCVFGKKHNATFNANCKNVVWRFPTVRGKIHPTQKPLPLLEYLIGVSSNIGDVILDPCAGSGNILLAAKNLQRKSIGIEINEEYCKMIKQRFESMVKQ